MEKGSDPNGSLPFLVNYFVNSIPNFLPNLSCTIHLSLLQLFCQMCKYFDPKNQIIFIFNEFEGKERFRGCRAITPFKYICARVCEFLAKSTLKQA